ncbi:phosphoserine phosphatase SerB [Parvularcula sp. IMCC14364]|uniref:phosphoserine phosphatase SerB n=1 Tax=Parvularcula sp. IMCC14364 TaxID=3067902 RepID=UPI002741F1FF|nr:phosphoserine phosphatase SerB [Parvularcula sp. IMCC14364]
MSYILTLVCHPATPALMPRLLDDVRTLTHGALRVLAEGIAAEVETAKPLSAETLQAIRELTENLPIDIAAQAAAGREKKLLIADMDSTIIQQECLDELAAFAGKQAEISAITERAMHGELDFEAALRERVSMLAGLPASKLDETLEQRITLTSGATELVRTMNARGAMTALVSGGFTYFTHRIAQAVGFLENQGNVLTIRDGLLTGDLEEPIFGRAAKKEALENICTLEGLTPAEALAVGDGANDLDMLQAAGTGVAFHAKPIVAEAARIRIDHADLTALLYLQGIPKAEFITA